MAKKNKETTVKDIVDIILPRLWIILLVGVLLAGIIGVYSIFIKRDTYTASAEIYVYKNSSSSNVTSSDIAAAEEIVNVYIRVITGDKFLKYVKNDMTVKDYNISTSRIASLLTVSKVEDTPNLIISVTSEDPEISSALTASVVDGVENYIEGNIITNTLEADVIEEPREAAAIPANSKNTVRNCLIAFFAGVIVAALCVWIHSSFDVVIRSSKKIEDNLDLPILGVIPRHEISLSSEEGKA